MTDETTNGNGAVRITVAKVYELLCETHDQVQAMREDVNVRLAVMDGEVHRLAKAEDLHEHENLYAHRGLVRSMKWFVGVAATFITVVLAIHAAFANY